MSDCTPDEQRVARAIDGVYGPVVAGYVAHETGGDALEAGRVRQEMSARAGRAAMAEHARVAGEKAKVEELCADLLSAKSREQAGWLRSIAVHSLNPTTEAREIQILRLAAECFEWDADRMSDAADAISRLAVALDAARMERARQVVDWEKLWAEATEHAEAVEARVERLRKVAKVAEALIQEPRYLYAYDSDQRLPNALAELQEGDR